MRTKTLLCLAALTAAGVTASMAQSSNVYSLNIVGYANIGIGGGNSLLANPFNKITGGVANNRADNVLPLAPLNGGPVAGTLDSFFIYTWNGGGYDTVYYEDDFTFGNAAGNPNGPTNGWASDGNGDAGTHAVLPPDLSPGRGFFINNQGSSNYTTFLGDVIPNPGFTNTVATIGGGNSLLGSALAVAGDNTGATSSFDKLQIALSPLNGGPAPGTMDSFFVYTWNGGGYDTAYYEDDFTFGNAAGNPNGPTNGWANNGNGDASTAAVLPPVIPIGHGFFINNQGASYTWKQTITNSP